MPGQVNAPLGVCVCGYPSWIVIDGEPNHPCCVDNGPNCEPCRISRDEARKRERAKTRRVRRLRH